MCNPHPTLWCAIDILVISPDHVYHARTRVVTAEAMPQQSSAKRIVHQAGPFSCPSNFFASSNLTLGLGIEVDITGSDADSASTTGAVTPSFFLFAF